MKTWYNHLWNGHMKPEDITPEYIRSLSQLSALKLMYWLNNYNPNNQKENKSL